MTQSCNRKVMMLHCRQMQLHNAALLTFQHVVLGCQVAPSIQSTGAVLGTI